MKKINLAQELQDRRDCLGWPYVSPGGTGKDCSKTGIDCSGMDVRAFRLQGNTSIYHGCNTEWRDGTFESKGKLTSVSQLQPGYAVLLNRPWRETDKGNKWYGDGDGNFTHIGHVLGVKPLEIIDASASAGKVRITTSIKQVGWTHWGRFRDIDYEDEMKGEEKGMTMKVYTSDGGALNVRKKCSTTSERVTTIPCGTEVEVVKDMGNGWAAVKVESKEGYVLSKYLTECDSNVTVEERLKKLEQMVQQLMNAVFEG